jgi:hypothetical protein
LDNDPLLDRCSMTVLRQALHEAELEPVRAFPAFGPIVFERWAMTRRPLDPRKCPIGIESNALNRDRSGDDALVDRVLKLEHSGQIT